MKLLFYIFYVIIYYIEYIKDIFILLQGKEQFYLVNYSPNGTVVDSVLYRITEADKDKPKKPSKLGKEIEAIEEIRNRRKKILNSALPVTSTSAKANDDSDVSSLYFSICLYNMIR